jgi:antitoxin (DNA-binding transcriptional repressor) of toxin-antitoxin stability system
MKRISMNELKQDLSLYIGEAAEGADIVITKLNKPIAKLSRPGTERLHQGTRFGNASLKPAIKGKTAGRYLEIFQDDRGADGE